jgi:hypothetical protein
MFPLDNCPMGSGHVDWTGHVVVCGLHDVAFRIVEELTQLRRAPCRRAPRPGRG